MSSICIVPLSIKTSARVVEGSMLSHTTQQRTTPREEDGARISCNYFLQRLPTAPAGCRGSSPLEHVEDHERDCDFWESPV